MNTFVRENSNRDNLLEINLIASSLRCCMLSDLEVMWLICDEHIGLSILYIHISDQPKSTFVLSHLGLRYTTADCGFEWCNRPHCIAHPTKLSFVSK